MANNQQPIIIKRIVEEGGHGHHGGAWKVAYADFVTAMMAFFLMLWLLGSANEAKLKGLADYFNSTATTNDGKEGGFGGFLDGTTPLSPNQMVPSSVSPFSIHPSIPFSNDDEGDPFSMDLTEGAEEATDLSDEALRAEVERREQAQFAEAKDAIARALDERPDLKAFKDSLLVDQTPEGLRVQIVDQQDEAMFDLASAAPLPHTRQLLAVVAEAIKALPQRLSVRGHTDALPFAPGATYDNWRLSSDRANATRGMLIDAGLPADRFFEVTGRAAAEPLLPDAPADPRNRRISLVLLHDAPPSPH
ncbi:MAG: OmpA family protein [Geminicoccaceae bacterium]|nr:OmpA family protein [Geminicoccaceae bacterium]